MDAVVDAVVIVIGIGISVWIPVGWLFLIQFEHSSSFPLLFLFHLISLFSGRVDEQVPQLMIAAGWVVLVQ